MGERAQDCARASRPLESVLARAVQPCVHVQVMVGERFLVTCTNALPVVALESELVPDDERLSAYLKVRGKRKSGATASTLLNKLEQSIMDYYKDPDVVDAVRVKAIVGHYLLHPFYLSTYQVEHVLELNPYTDWVLSLLDALVIDPSPLLRGEVNGLQYWNAPITFDPLLKYALHTPARGDTNFLKMLVGGLKEMRVWAARHSAEMRDGGKLDLGAMRAELREETWTAMASHPVDNLGCERVLAHDCYLTRVLGTVLRVHNRAGMVKWAMNVKLGGGRLAIDGWEDAHVQKTMEDAMAYGRAKVETMEEESARLHRERLPFLRENQRMFEVREEKRAAVMHAFVKMRAEGREVRRVGAIAVLTGPQVTKQIALRVFLDKVEVARRTGKKDEMVAVLRDIVEKEVAAREARDGADAVLTDDESTRLRDLGLGKKQRAARARTERPTDAPRQRRAPRAPRQPRQKAIRRAEPCEGSDGWMSSSEESDESDESESDESGASDNGSDSDDSDGIDEEEILAQENVYVVEKVVGMREAAGGGREFHIKWRGYGPKQNTWEPEENVTAFNAKLLDSFLRAREKAAAKEAAKEAARAAQQATAPAPTRARSSRAGASKAAEKARAAAAAEDRSDLEEDDSPADDEAEEAEEPAPAPAARKKRGAGNAAPKAPAAKAAKAAKAKAAKRPKPAPAPKKKKTQPPAPAAPDSSDEEAAARGEAVAAARPIDSSDEEAAAQAGAAADAEEASDSDASDPSSPPTDDSSEGE